MSEEDLIDLLALKFSSLSLESKQNTIDWIESYFPDSLAKTLLFQHLTDSNVIVLDKFNERAGNLVTFYIRFYNKRKKEKYCRFVTLTPKTVTCDS